MEDAGEFKGKFGEKTKLGIVTRTDAEYNYVWAAHLRTLELRYPLNPQCAFMPGDIVTFIQIKDGRGPQIVHDLVKEKDPRYQLEVIRLPSIKPGAEPSWKVKTKLVFAPFSNAAFLRMKAADKRVQALAFADNFLLVVSFLPVDGIVPGVVYTDFVTRVPDEQLAKRVGTLFCLRHKKGAPYEIVKDAKAIDEFMKECPFRDEVQPIRLSDEEEEIDLPLLASSNISQSSNRNKWEDNINHIHGDYENYAEQLTAAEEGQAYLGLIVRTEKEYSVIWSPQHDLVRVDLTAEDDEQQWSLCSWVKYRCFEEHSQLQRGINCNFKAYDISAAEYDGNMVTTCNTEVGKEIIIQAFLSDPELFNNQFFYAYDKFLGQILCSQDRHLKAKLQNENGAEVWAIFTEDCDRCRWGAFSMLTQEHVYCKLDLLPPVIENTVKPIFERVEINCRMPQPDEQEHLWRVGARFKPPPEWKGPTKSGNRIMDVLGMVMGYEQHNTVTVIATLYGTARQPKHFDLGSWVLATIAEEDGQVARDPTYLNLLNGECTYRVLHSKKISPPMSTRVIETEGTKKILLCGDVKAGPLGLKNDFLGQIEDNRTLIPTTGDGESYLVELGLRRQAENRKKCFWSVLKFHGKSVKNVHKVPIQMSFYPYEEGRTCDDAHTLLLDAEFDAEQYAREHGNSVSHPFSSISVCESVPLNQHQPKQQIGKSNTGDCYATGGTKQFHSNNAGVSSNFNTVQMDDASSLLAQLHLYVPSNEKKRRANAVVVRKRPEYVLLYSRDYGLGIVLPKYAKVQSEGEFSEKFPLGDFVLAKFVRVADHQAKQLTYEWMCTGKFLPSNKRLPSRVVGGCCGFVQVQVGCAFFKENLTKCDNDHYVIDTDVGNVRFSKDLLQYNDFSGKTVLLWVTYIQKCDGCNSYWQIVLGERNSFKIYLGDLLI